MRVERHTERRNLVAPMRQAAVGWTRVLSLRQLPTDHDHVGGPYGPIHEYQSDQPSLSSCSTLVRVLYLNDHKGGT